MFRSMSVVPLLFVAALLLIGLFAGKLDGEQPDSMDPKVRRVIQEIADLHREVRTLRVNLESAMIMEAEGFEQTQKSRSDISYKRPDLYAFRSTPGRFSPTIVSDGKQVFTYYPIFKQYTRKEVSEEGPMGASATGGMAAGGVSGPAFLLAIPNDQLVELLFEGVEKTEYLGKVDLEGTSCHHLKFTQAQVDWELWVQAEKRSLPRRLGVDMSKTFAQRGTGESPLGGSVGRCGNADDGELQELENRLADSG